MNRPDPQASDFAAATMRRLIEVRLNARLHEATTSSTAHPDEDVIAAFMEAQLDDAQARQVISHLVNCSSCLHLTAELMRHEPEIEDIQLSQNEERPGHIQRLLDSLVNAVVPRLNEDAVFAYEEKAEDNGSEEEKNREPESET